MKFQIITVKTAEVMAHMEVFQEDILRRSNGLVSASAKKSKGGVLLTIITPLDNPMFERIFKPEIENALKTIDEKVKVIVVKG